MTASLQIFAFAAAVTAVLLGLIDAGALAFGGSSLAATAAAGAVLAAFSLRLAEAGSPLREALLGVRPRWLGPRLALVLVALLGWYLPELAPWGGARGSAMAALLLFMVLSPLLGPVAARFADALGAGGNGRRELCLAGSLLGAALTVSFGLGPTGWLAACGFAWLTVPKLAADADMDAASAEAAANASLAPAGRLETAAWVLTGFALAGAALFLLPLLELYDASSTVQDLRRLLGLGIPAALAGLLFGGLADGRWRLPLAALAAVGVYLGLDLAAGMVSRFDDPRVFNGLLSDPRFTRFAQEGAVEGSRLGEDDLAYAPYLAIRIAGLVAVCGGVLLRQAVGARGRTGLGPLGLGAAGALVWIAFAGTEVGAGLLDQPLPWLLCAAGGLALASPLPVFGRLLLAAALAGLPWWQLGPTPAPDSSVPFYDSFEYAVVEQDGKRAELRAPATRLRLIERLASQGGDPEQTGPLLLADGRNYLRQEFGARSPRADEAALLARLVPQATSALLVGPPHAATLSAWQAAGVRQTGLACDPAALARLAARFDPGWRAVRLSILAATVAETEGPYDLILVRDEALWQRRRNPLRESLFATAAGKLAPGGRFAVSLEPARLAPGVVGGVAQAMRARFARVELWIVPQAWREPRLLVVGGDSPSLAPGEGARLSPLLLVAADDALDALPAVSLRGPLAPVVQRLASTEYRRPDEGRATARAGRVLAALRKQLGGAGEDSLLGFYASHLAAQVYEVRDDYENPPEKEWLDLGEASLAELYRLTKLHPEDEFLRGLWRQLAPLVVEKKEVEWALRYFGGLTGSGSVDLGAGPEPGLGWADPDLLFVTGQAWLEMLMPDRALLDAEQALGLDPAHFNSRVLRARALAGLERHAESLAAFRQVVGAAEPGPPALLLAAWAEEALASGDRELALQVAGRLRREHGDAALSRPLRQLFGLGDPDAVHLFPGMQHDGD